jgi:hypothetical protein
MISFLQWRHCPGNEEIKWDCDFRVHRKRVADARFYRRASGLVLATNLWPPTGGQLLRNEWRHCMQIYQIKAAVVFMAEPNRSRPHFHVGLRCHEMLLWCAPMWLICVACLAFVLRSSQHHGHAQHSAFACQAQVLGEPVFSTPLNTACAIEVACIHFAGCHLLSFPSCCNRLQPTLCAGCPCFVVVGSFWPILLMNLVYGMFPHSCISSSDGVAAHHCGRCEGGKSLSVLCV